MKPKKNKYPSFICHECATKVGGILKVGISTWHLGNCDVCGELKSLTEPRDYGYPEFYKEEITKKIVKTPCYMCNESLRGQKKPRKGCKECNGTGQYKEYHYIISDGKNAVDADTLK